MQDSKTRFSTRVDNYVKYRPHYPDELMDILREECGVQPMVASWLDDLPG